MTARTGPPWYSLAVLIFVLLNGGLLVFLEDGSVALPSWLWPIDGAIFVLLGLLACLVDITGIPGKKSIWLAASLLGGPLASQQTRTKKEGLFLRRLLGPEMRLPSRIEAAREAGASG